MVSAVGGNALSHAQHNCMKDIMANDYPCHFRERTFPVFRNAAP